MTTQSPDFIRLSGGHVVLSGEATIQVWRFMSRAADLVSRGDGVPIPPRLQVLLEVLRTAAAEAMSEMSAADVRGLPVAPVSDPTDEITTSEAAEMLKVTDRHVRRIHQTLDGCRRGNQWVFSRAAVTAYRDGSAA